MGESYQPRHRHNTAGYLKSRAVYFGLLLTFIGLVMQLVQLFEEAQKRSVANQAPPEAFTASGIAWRAVFIVFVLVLCILLARFANGKIRMGRARFCLLAGFLLVVFGAVRFINLFLEILVYPEFINILDCLTIGVCILAPIILLELADLNGDLPDDNVLLLLGIGGVGFSIISTLIISIVLRESYTTWRLVPELLFRAAMILFGVGALQKALALRAAYPLAAPAAPAPKPKREKKRPSEDDSFTLRLDDALEQESRAYTARTPRPDVRYDDSRQYTVRSSRPDAYDSLEPRAYTARTPRPEAPYGSGRPPLGQSTPRNPDAPNRPSNTARMVNPYTSDTLWQTGRIIVQGGTGRIPTQDPGMAPSERQTCPYCGKRMPLGFPNCPRCGRDM